MDLRNRSPVTHKMAPWVSKVFIHILPRILCIERPKKDNPPNDDDGGPVEVLTDVYHCPPDLDKFTRDYGGSKRYSADYGIPGKRIRAIFLFLAKHQIVNFA